MWKRYLAATPANVARVMLIIKGALGIAIGSEWASGNLQMALYFALAGYVLQEVANFLTEKPLEDQMKDNKE